MSQFSQGFKDSVSFLSVAPPSSTVLVFRCILYTLLGDKVMEDCPGGFRDQACKSITSVHTPLDRTQSCDHTQVQGKLGKTALRVPKIPERKWVKEAASHLLSC